MSRYILVIVLSLLLLPVAAVRGDETARSVLTTLGEHPLVPRSFGEPDPCPTYPPGFRPKKVLDWPVLYFIPRQEFLDLPPTILFENNGMKNQDAEPCPAVSFEDLCNFFAKQNPVANVPCPSLNRPQQPLFARKNGSDWSSTILFADDLELGGWELTSLGIPQTPLPRKLIIVADTIRISKPCVFRLNGFDASHPNGGNLLLVARRLLWGSNGEISFYANSFNGSEDHRETSEHTSELPFRELVNQGAPERDQEFDRQFRKLQRPEQIQDTPEQDREFDRQVQELKGKQGRGRRLMFRELVLPEQIQKSDPGRGGHLVLAVGSVEIVGEQNRDVTAIDNKVRAAIYTSKSSKDACGVTRLFHVTPEILGSWLPCDSHSKWLEYRLDLAYRRARQAEQNGAREDLVSALRDFKNLRVDHFSTDEQQSRIKWLTLLNRSLERVMRRTVRLSQDSRVVTSEVFTDGETLDSFLAPTELVVQPNQLQGRNYLGVLCLHPRDSDRLEIQLDARLSIDPWLFQAARTELAKEQEQVQGLFTDWTLSVARVPAGLEDLRATAIGDSVQISLVVDRASANLILFRLGSRTGLPVPLSYECKKNPKLRGEILLPLSLTRRTEVSLGFDGRTATNRGKNALTVAYVRIEKDHFAALEKPLRLAPGESAVVPLPEGTTLKSVTIPAEAVVVQHDPFAFDEFYVLNPKDLVEHIVLVNQLGSDPKRGGELRQVRVQVTYMVGEGAERVEVPAGLYVLGPRLQENATREILLLKPKKGGKPHLLIEGTAEYANGRHSFKATQEGLSVRISESMLEKTGAP